MNTDDSDRTDERRIRLICLIRREKSGRRLTTSPVSHEKLFTSLNTNTINETYSFIFNN